MGAQEKKAEYHEEPAGSLIPVDGDSARKAFAEIESGVVIRSHPTIMYHDPGIEAISNGEFPAYAQIDWYKLIVMGYVDDLRYRNVMDQGTFAYLRAVELRGQTRGIVVPVIDTFTVLAYDNDLVGLDTNAKEAERERKVNDEMFTGLVGSAASEKMDFAYSSLFYKDARAGQVRHRPLSDRLSTVGEREKVYVENYRRSPLYVDEIHEKAFLLPASILHDMLRIKEELLGLQRAFGE